MKKKGVTLYALDTFLMGALILAGFIIGDLGKAKPQTKEAPAKVEASEVEVKKLEKSEIQVSVQPSAPAGEPEQK